MKSWKKLSATERGQIIGGIFAIIAAIIIGIFTYLSSNKEKVKNEINQEKIFTKKDIKTIKQTSKNNLLIKYNKINENFGPYFISKNDAEKNKQSYIPYVSYHNIIDKKAIEKRRPKNSVLYIRLRSGIWSQNINDNAKVLVKIIGNKCNKKVEFYISNHINQIDPNNYNNSSLMKEKEKRINWDCHSEIIKRIEVFAYPGTYALSIDSIKIFNK